MDCVSLGDLITAAPIVKCGDGTYPVLSMTMHDGIMLQSDRFKKSLASIDQSNYKVVSNGQLVVGFPIDEGVLYVQRVVDKGIMSPAYNVWDIKTSLVIPEYLELALHSPFAMEYYKSKLRGTTARRRTLPTNELLALPIILPNFDIQEKVICACNKTASLIALRKEQMSKLDQLVKSRFIELFGDGSYRGTPLIQLIVEGAGLSYGIIVPGDNVEDGVPMVRPSDFKNDELCLDNVYKVASEIEAKYARTRLIGDEILVQVIGQPGQIMLSDSRCKGMNVTRNLAVVRPDCSRINRIYLKTYMQSQEAQAFMLGETKQSTLKQLPLSRLKELVVPVPPIVLQEKFAAFVEQTDKSKLAIQQSLDKLELLKKSLMQEYFG